MTKISQSRIKKILSPSKSQPTTTQRGKALEDLICYLFGKIPGMSVQARNQMNVYRTEELDVVFWNTQDPQALYFLPNIIPVECKNWSNPVGSSEVSWFDGKIKRRGLQFGVLVAMNGITGTAYDRSAAHEIIAAALLEQRKLVVINKEEIQTFTDTTQVVSLIQKKLCELALEGTIYP